ncbi:hypothetical protein K491DRAFT_723193 [Lophiostoma macrostomum CBS 122681]|uniref:Uncharacterized protein n=1 Tax=Lophiostoma macrostomum CBS 122681 TaxID=1314788 RepID=A0A6A6SNF8_9PLEO|nr:hypothetical protein K491DRAFT_723193 [Lophiostoma macrostomum CBS 122681]
MLVAHHIALPQLFPQHIHDKLRQLSHLYYEGSKLLPNSADHNPRQAPPPTALPAADSGSRGSSSPTTFHMPQHPSHPSYKTGKRTSKDIAEEDQLRKRPRPSPPHWNASKLPYAVEQLLEDTDTRSL